jgi:hypothetical protein
MVGACVQRILPECAFSQVYEGLVSQLEPPKDPQQQQQQLSSSREVANLPPDQQALVWIQYMRFCRRGESLTACRRVSGGLGFLDV